MLRIFAISISFLAGNVVYAASFKRLIEKTIDEIIDPLIIVIFGIATLYFLWGVAEFIGKASDEKGREEGKQKIIWGLVGLAIMVSVYGIVGMISDFFLDVNGGGGFGSGGGGFFDSDLFGDD